MGTIPMLEDNQFGKRVISDHAGEGSHSICTARANEQEQLRRTGLFEETMYMLFPMSRIAAACEPPK